MKRVICIGNRFLYPDNFGMLVYEKLKTKNLKDVEVVEGGIGGLNLSSYFEDDAKILIVDFAKGYEKKLLTPKDIEKIELKEYNHDSAFLYLLKSIDKDYKIYVRSEDFNEEDIQKSVDEIMEIVQCM
jgi:hydrogenase maturation protease